MKLSFVLCEIRQIHIEFFFCLKLDWLSIGTKTVILFACVLILRYVGDIISSGRLAPNRECYFNDVNIAYKKINVKRHSDT